MKKRIILICAIFVLVCGVAACVWFLVGSKDNIMKNFNKKNNKQVSKEASEDEDDNSSVQNQALESQITLSAKDMQSILQSPRFVEWEQVENDQLVISIDMNGDGKNETLGLYGDVDETQEGMASYMKKGKVKINNDTYKNTYYMLFQSVSFISFDKKNILACVIYRDEEDKLYTEFLAYENKKVESKGIVYSDCTDVTITDEGHIPTFTYISQLPFVTIDIELEYKDGEIKQVEQEEYNIVECDSKWLIYNNLKLYVGKDLNGKYGFVGKGSQVRITRTDGKEWIYVQDTASNKQGWVKVVDAVVQSENNLPFAKLFKFVG